MNLDLGGVDCSFCVLGDCGVLDGVLAWERSRGAGEGGEGEEFRFQMVDLGESTAHFCFAARMSMVLVSVVA